MGLVAALALALSACATEAATNPLTGARLGTVQGGPEPAADPAAVAEAAVADVNDYWRRTYPETYGSEFEELRGGFHPYGPDTEMPPCEPNQPTYAEIADNAFYCPTNDLIAWDAAQLIPWVNENFGAFTIGIVMAHEFAHAVQARAGVSPAIGMRTVDIELQADCFAGAWTSDVVAGNSEVFSIDEAGLDASVAGLVAISDVPGTVEEDPLAHGSGFDRIGSFLDGYEGGPDTCADYAGTQRLTVEIPFAGNDAETGGNMVLGDGADAPDGAGLLTRVERDLNGYFDLLFDELGTDFRPVEGLRVVDPDEDEVTCGGGELSGDALRYAALFCEDENIVVIDGPGLVLDLYEIGDFAVAAEIARLWAQAAQDQLGVGEGKGESLQADCLVGVWALSNFARDGFEPDNLVMSAGDLDEGIMGFLAYGVPAEGAPTVFERTDALRTGFVEGYPGCEEYAPLG